MANASRDENSVPSLLAVSSTDGVTPIAVYADPTTHRLLVTSGSGGFVQVQAATGTVDGSNTTFTFTTEPNIIVVDNRTLRKTSSDGTENWTGTTTVVLAIAPNYDIFSII